MSSAGEGFLQASRRKCPLLLADTTVGPSTKLSFCDYSFYRYVFFMITNIIKTIIIAVFNCFIFGSITCKVFLEFQPGWDVLVSRPRLLSRLSS